MILAMPSDYELELDAILREVGPQSLVALRREKENQLHERRMLEARHRHRLESMRLFIAFLLVAVLFGILVIGLFRDIPGQDINQFATPISGLAGIAVGWLFARREDRDVGQQLEEGQPAP